jgi:hypothetical protein
MNLPNLPFLEKKENSEYFLSLVLRDEKVSAVVFKEVNGRINVVGEHAEIFKSSLEDATDEELLNAVDRAVSIAEKSLPEGVESQKTIFGLKQDWITDGKIKPEYLAKLKKVSDELQFKPVGFLVITEAIAHLLQKEEGAPVSAIITEVGKKSITVSLVKAGKILETKSAELTADHSVPVSVDALLKHITTAEILPSRIIIFDNGSEKLQQEFIAHKWSRELGFLHVPQITNLPSSFDARAVLAGAASQMGFEVLEASVEKAEKEDSLETLEPIVPVEDEDKTLAEAASEFGFTTEDLAEKPKTAVDESVMENVKSDNIALAEEFKEIPEEEKIKTSDSRSLGVNAAAMGASMGSFISKLKLGGAFSKVKSGPKKRLLVLAVPLIVLLLIVLFYIFGRTATVTLGVNSRTEEKTENITFSEDSATDASDNVINVKIVTSTQDGKVTTAATGKKETGDKAKGTVTIFNSSTDGGKTLQAGTVITSSNDLKFVLDKAVTVASASGDIFSGTEPGKADVSVTAEKFGTSYNLPSNTKFTVEGTSDIAAKNDKAFTGGTKKDVKVVSQKDLDKLEKDLQEKLEGDAKSEIESKASGEYIVLPNFTSVEFDKQSFSHKVDAEANEVSLTGTISFEGVSYKKSDLVDFAKDKLADEVGNDMMIDEDKVEVEASDISTKNNRTTAKVNIKAALVPKIDEEEIADEIAGKSIKDATTTLQSLPEVERVNVNVFLNLPFLPQRLPFSAGKIKVNVEKNG